MSNFIKSLKYVFFKKNYTLKFCLCSIKWKKELKPFNDFLKMLFEKLRKLNFINAIFDTFLNDDKFDNLY